MRRAEINSNPWIGRMLMKLDNVAQWVAFPYSCHVVHAAFRMKFLTVR